MITRQLELKDIPRLVELGKVNFPEYGNLDISMEDELMLAFKDSYWGKPTYIVIIDYGKVLGCVGYCLSSLDYNCYELFWVNIDPEYQNEGLGSYLVTSVVKDYIQKEKSCKKDLTILLSCKITLASFYNRLGFNTILQKAARLEVLMGKTILIEQ